MRVGEPAVISRNSRSRGAADNAAGDAADATPPTLRDRVRTFIELRTVKNAILALIVFNAVTLGLSTSPTVMSYGGGFIRMVDEVVLGVFVVELLLKFFAYGLSFFRSLWNLFDLFVVVIGLMPKGDGISALRGLRIIRALRLLSALPQIRAVVQALLDALPGMGAVVIMLSIIFYVFGVMATLMYGPGYDAWFGTLGRSLYSLFQIMTLESWSMGIVRPVMEEHPYAWALFVPFIIITAFSVLNLFIGLLVNTMQAAVEAETDAEFEQLRELVRTETDVVDRNVRELTEEIRRLRAEVEALRRERDDG